MFNSASPRASAIGFKDLVLDATIIPQSNYFITVGDLVGSNSAGLLRYNMAETGNPVNCHTRWSPRLPTTLNNVRNRPVDTPQYYLAHMTHSRNALVSSGYHG